MPRQVQDESLDDHAHILLTKAEKRAVKAKAAQEDRSVSWIGRKLFLRWLKEKAK